MNDKQRDKKLFELQEVLPLGLPQPPKYMVQLARNHKKLVQIRQMHRQYKEPNEAQKKYQGLTLESFKKCLLQVDNMHMKTVIELKSLLKKRQELNKFVENNK